jgi:hypothetical protein
MHARTNAQSSSPPSRQVRYVTVAGRYIKGVPFDGEGSLKAKFAGAGYQQVGTRLLRLGPRNALGRRHIRSRSPW